ncbi:hypothetical protein [Nostoc sp.]
MTRLIPAISNGTLTNTLEEIMLSEVAILREQMSSPTVSNEASKK